MTPGVALLPALLTACNLGLSFGWDTADLPDVVADSSVDSSSSIDTADTAVEANATCNGQKGSINLTGEGTYTLTSAAWYHEARSATLFAVEGYNDACDVAANLDDSFYYSGIQVKAFIKNWEADSGTMVGVVSSDPISSSGPYALVSAQIPSEALFESGVNGSIQIHEGFVYANDIASTLNVIFGVQSGSSKTQTGIAEGDLTACWCPILNTAFGSGG